MKKKLEIMIKHLEDTPNDTCDCPLCLKQEYGTFLDGLRSALNLIPKRRK